MSLSRSNELAAVPNGHDVFIEGVDQFTRHPRCGLPRAVPVEGCRFQGDQLLEGEEMETATKDCRVILANERIVPVTVALCFGETPPFYYLAPHTAHLKPFVVIDRG